MPLQPQGDEAMNGSREPSGRTGRPFAAPHVSDAGVAAEASDSRSRPGGHAERHPGMIDVARVAGVSYQTVSRVVNKLPDVSSSTREKVLAAIEQLGYRRNSAARALKTRRSTTLGIVSGGSARLGPVRTLLELE